MTKLVGLGIMQSIFPPVMTLRRLRLGELSYNGCKHWWGSWKISMVVLVKKTKTPSVSVLWY